MVPFLPLVRTTNARNVQCFLVTISKNGTNSTIGRFAVFTIGRTPNVTKIALSLTGDRRQAKHVYLAKQFCFLDADCLVVGESQGSSRRSAGKYPVKPPRPEGDSQTIGTDAGTIDSFFNN